MKNALDFNLSSSGTELFLAPFVKEGVDRNHHRHNKKIALACWEGKSITASLGSTCQGIFNATSGSHLFFCAFVSLFFDMNYFNRQTSTALSESVFSGADMLMFY